MRLEIKTKEADYLVELERFGFSGSAVRVYKVTDCKFLWFNYRAGKLIAKSLSSCSYEDAVLMGPYRVKCEAESVISRYERSKKEWEDAGAEL